jgi:hypothetical protein
MTNSRVNHESWIGKNITGKLLGPIENTLHEVPVIGGILALPVTEMDKISDWVMARVGDVLENIPILPVK